jgi:PBP1b-binding outer membrane lipoprotein LpoB
MNKTIIALLLIAIGLSSCVQKTYERKVKFILDVSKIENIKTVGIRGSNNPLSWQKDIEMKPIFKDSIYAVDVTFVTGYLGAEVKFVVNDEFEFQDQENRRIPFDLMKDTTIFRAVYNRLPQ